MITVTHRVEDVRNWFRQLKQDEAYVTDKSGCKMLEVVGATFLADEETIFGDVNHDYVQREIQWYESQSLNVHDIPGNTPKAWLACASSKGFINSNYGYLIWSDENGRQYENVLNELKKNPESRRAQMIYTRPTMWTDYNVDGMSDFVCTNVVQYFIRDGKLITSVEMRSNDVVYGFRNDVAWQKHIHENLARDLDVKVGEMLWHAGSLHVYERHFHFIK